MQKGYTYTRKRASGLSVVAVAADGLATRDIGKALVGISVDQRVQESESRSACTETGIVQEGNNTGHDGRGRRSATAGGKLAALEHGVTVQFVSDRSRQTEVLKIRQWRMKLTQGSHCELQHRGSHVRKSRHTTCSIPWSPR